MAEKKTLLETKEFKGKPVLSIWKIDDAGNKVGEWPIISFGKAKATAILENAEEIKKFVDTNNKE